MNGTDEPRTIKISLEGDPAEVQRLLQRLAGPPPTPLAPLYVSRSGAARTTGIPEDRLSAHVRAGRLTNYGTARSMLLSLAEIQALHGS